MNAGGEPSTAAPKAAPRSPQPADESLRLLDRRVEEALASGDESSLAVLGYGEISLVLGWPADDPRFACKRLPVFPDRARFESYGKTLADYLKALSLSRVKVVDTQLRPVPSSGRSVAGYVVQPVLPSTDLAPEVLGRADPGAGHPLVAEVVETAARTVDQKTGIDAQLSNWVWDESGLVYLDVSTPMLWSDDGRSRLDLELLSQAFPWVLRGALRRFLAPRILDSYRDLRSVYLDLCGNLVKQRLEAWLPAFLEQVARHLEPALTAAQVHRYYRSDARLWAMMLRIRRLDRGWQRRIRRRPYPLLLPKEIER